MAHHLLWFGASDFSKLGKKLEKSREEPHMSGSYRNENGQLEILSVPVLFKYLKR